MDPLEKSENKSASSLIIIVMLTTASFVLYMITYYFIESNPVLPLQFDFATYAICLIVTMVIVSIPSLVVYKMGLD
jgi:hypothetical protein